MTAFTKMHGLGNDFIVIDSRTSPIGALLDDRAAIARLSDRRLGIGCDQFIVIADTPGATAEMLIRNSDGSVAGMCGNAARCVADMLLAETGQGAITLKVGTKTLDCRRDAATGDVSVDMGPPLAHGRQDVGLGLPVGTTVDMGNPHIVFMVPDADAVDLAAIGPQVENHPAFPARTNVEFVSATGEGQFRMRVWERGAGITMACGSGACASAYAVFANGLSPRKNRIRMDGGWLSMEIREGDGHVIMTGPVAYVFKGTF